MPFGVSVERWGRAALGLMLALAIWPRPARADPTPSIPADGAQWVFDQATAICARDQGRLWGEGLCGPILLVDPNTGALAANMPDPKGVLKLQGGIWVGAMPGSEPISNSPMEWSGRIWTELFYPRPGDDDMRHVEIAHELFHRIQPDLGLIRKDGDNAHLDTMEGRYLMQLEWRALARALRADRPEARLRAIDDALAFRVERYRLFPGAAENERALELNEAIAEYTGVKLGLVGADAQTAYALRDLSSHVADPTFVRSFAYATGPAYGLLLDRYAPGWRSRLKSHAGLDALLRAAVPAIADAPGLKTRIASYDDGTLHTAEEARERQRQATLAILRGKFISGPVIQIPAHHVNYQFHPQTLQPLEEAGTVYPSIRVSGPFGALEAHDGALMTKDEKAVVISAAGADLKALKGDGWTLTLAPGWTLKPGPRPGDWTVTPPAQ